MRIFALALLAGVSLVQARNPLATTDQSELDALSIELSRDPGFEPLKKEALNQYLKSLKKYHVDITDAVMKDLHLAIEELVFSSVQKAANGDPTHPKVYWTDTAPRRHNWFGLSVPGSRYSYDNPDSIYRTVPIDGKYKYKLKGRRFGNGTTDTSFSLISNVNSQNTISTISKKDLKVNADGTYEITISSEDIKENHLKSDWTAKQIFIRNNLGDWNKETPDELEVEVQGNPKPWFPRTNRSIINDAKNDLKQSTFFYGFGALDLKTLSVPVNVLKDPSQSQSLGTLTSQAQSFGHYKIQDDEAYVITINGGKSSYWVVPVYTMGMVTNDPEHNIVSFNSVQSAPNNNGTYTFVLSAKDPNVYNWISIAGMPQGTFMLRWQGLPPSDGTVKDIKVNTQVVKFDKLHEVLPNGTRYVSAKERQQQIRERLQGYQRIHFQ
ncbi:Uncharacterized protein MSYG_4361 [Malassezia sympodialis ATCC 42132]|uniref:DUF1214 domain-containing protein n=2 Tax=Malassezia sympodialis (strain ATCC 42132) TaxID=1230383 RepID=A0A1M8AC10_MALS4|nr:Uncharacterized protein MSYG_4361 [Malassezia sympodialis ATCC 42132]